MPRAVWNGALGFGLVNIPVALYPATVDRSVRFNQFEEGTSDRIRYRKVNERTGKEVETDRIVRGVAVGGGDYVLLTDEELEAVEPERSHLIEISDFVDLVDIDPWYYRATYYLVPEDESSDKAYALLRRAMADSERVAVATMVMRTKEYLVTVRADGDALVLATMYFADELRARRELPALPGADRDIADKELTMALRLIEAMGGDWDPKAYHDHYRERLEALVERKLEGQEVVTEAAPSGRAPVIDLMEALNASMRRTGGGRGGGGRGGGTQGGGDGNRRGGGGERQEAAAAADGGPTAADDGGDGVTVGRAARSGTGAPRGARGATRSPTGSPRRGGGAGTAKAGGTAKKTTAKRVARPSPSSSSSSRRKRAS